jgi:hypothetical protein
MLDFLHSSPDRGITFGNRPIAVKPAPAQAGGECR